MASLAQLTAAEGLPSSIHTEITILGAMLLDATAIEDAVAKLHPLDFSLDSHRRIFRAMLDMRRRGVGIDLTTLRAELEKNKELDTVGGPAYLFYLTEGIPRNLNIESYVHIVKDKSLLRAVQGIGSDIQARASDQSEDAISIISDAQSMLSSVSESAIYNRPISVAEIVTTSFGNIDNLIAQPEGTTGLLTHFRDFDAMTRGMHDSDLIIIAARPSMGKTAWAINIAQNAAVKDGKVVAVFSLEMSKEALLRRMLATESSVSSQKMYAGFVGATERTRLYSGLERLMGCRLFIDDTAGIGLNELRTKARSIKRQEGQLDLILVDYLQLMTADGENRTQEVSKISRGLKAIAKDLKVPVVALSQLSRNSEQRTGDKRPRLSDLRESGSIEQDADVVAFIHREEYYEPDNADLRGRAEIIVAKQRNGPTGTVGLAWIGEYTRFENYSPA